MSERETVRCSCCGLNQYKRESQKCGRCKASYAPKIEQDGSPANPPSVSGESSIADHAGLPVIARNVKYFRQASGMSQRDLGRRCGRVRTFLSKVERGRHTPTVKTLQNLARNLGVTPGDLLNEREIGFQTNDPYLLEITAYLPHLNPKYRDCILDFVRKMATIRGTSHLSAQPDYPGREPEHRGAVAGSVLDLRSGA